MWGQKTLSSTAPEIFLLSTVTQAKMQPSSVKVCMYTLFYIYFIYLYNFRFCNCLLLFCNYSTLLYMKCPSSIFFLAGLDTTVQEVCDDGDVRLVDGPNLLEGRVEICINNAWGTVCDNSFSLSDANVICTQLGYSFNGTRVLPISEFSQGTGPIFLDELACEGGEEAVLDCNRAPLGLHACTHSQDVAVQCIGEYDASLDFLLIHTYAFDRLKREYPINQDTFSCVKDICIRRWSSMPLLLFFSLQQTTMNVQWITVDVSRGV